MVTRYNPGVKYSPEMGVYSPSMNVRSGGNYTLYDDYAKLEAENKALKVEFEVLKDSNSTLKNRISNALKTSEDLRNDLL